MIRLVLGYLEKLSHEFVTSVNYIKQVVENTGKLQVSEILLDMFNFMSEMQVWNLGLTPSVLKSNII